MLLEDNPTLMKKIVVRQLTISPHSCLECTEFDCGISLPSCNFIFHFVDFQPTEEALIAEVLVRESHELELSRRDGCGLWVHV